MLLGRRRLVIIISALVVLIAVVTTAVLFRKDNSAVATDSYEAVCKDLISAIGKKDFKRGYNMLSKNAKKAETLESWTDKTSVLGNIYFGKITLADKTQLDDSSGNSGQAHLIQLTYSIDNNIATSLMTCVATSQGG